jgi:hypothetical protein
VLSVTPIRAGKLFALAAVEIDIDGIRIEVRGIRAMRVKTSLVDSWALPEPDVRREIEHKQSPF